MMPRSNRLLRLFPIAGLLALAAAGFVPAPSSGQGPAPSTALNGTWRLQGSVQQAQQTIAAAVNPAVQPLAPDIQRMARARIAESTAVPQTIQINASGSQIQIAVTGADSRTFTTAPGQPQNVYSRSGVRAQLIQQFRPDGGIEQNLRAMDGTQHNFYTPHGNQMLLDVMLQSRRLAREVRFRLTYTR